MLSTSYLLICLYIVRTYFQTTDNEKESSALQLFGNVHCLGPYIKLGVGHSLMVADKARRGQQRSGIVSF